MNKPSKHPNFSAGDIERYHTGKMSYSERNAIEKAALEDAFLADALEGYAYTSTQGSDLNDIRQKLHEKTSRKKSTPLFFRSNRFMRAAAIILLVAGAGWLITRMATSAPEKDMAVSNKTELATPNLPEQKTEVEANKNYSLSTDTVHTERESIAGGKALKEIAAGNNVAASRKKTPEESAKKGDVASVEFSASAPVRLQEVAAKRDSSYTIAATDLYGVEIRGDSIKNLNIVMVESDQVLNEVVVLDKRQNRAMAKAKPVEEIEPIGGWEVYNSYALSNLKPPSGSDDKPQTGDVVLSFDINTLGEPTNIQVVESFCQTCEKEAKRILMEGPKWKNKNKKSAKIRIRF